jgi:hypothetical protein
MAMKKMAVAEEEVVVVSPEKLRLGWDAALVALRPPSSSLLGDFSTYDCDRVAKIFSLCREDACTAFS